MKLASFGVAGRTSYGIVEGDTVIDLGAAFDTRLPTLRAYIAAGMPNLVPVEAPRLRLDMIRLLPVIPDPSKIFCVGHNYETHRQETGRAKTQYPSIFIRFADSQIGHGAPIILPRASEKLDYEGELAVIIGAGGRNIAEDDALAHVAGYACYNDVSVRDWQWHTQQFTPGKNFPGTGAFGPLMVTADELADPQSTSVTTRLNGIVMQSQPTSDMIFSVARIIAYISMWTPLTAGDVIVSGTPGGVGAKRIPPVWLKDGDTIEIDIPNVGRLVNQVKAES